MRHNDLPEILDQREEYEPPQWTPDQALRQYQYWADRAHEIRISPDLGPASDSYRAATEMSARWLGRYDVLTAWEYRDQRDAES